MFDPKAYRNDCARLTLGQEKIEEMIQVTENQNKKSTRRPLRMAVIAAAAVALLGCTALAASPIGQAAIQNIFFGFSVVSVNDDGEGSNIIAPVIEMRKEDGRTILVMDDEETDITDALAENGFYTCEKDGVQITVDENGLSSMSFQAGDDEPYYIHRGGEERHPGTEDGQEQFTVLPGPNGEMNIYDGNGNLVDSDLPPAGEEPVE